MFAALCWKWVGEGGACDGEEGLGGTNERRERRGRWGAEMVAGVDFDPTIVLWAP